MKHTNLSDAIRAYGKTALPMHMPGHKRNTALLGSTLPYDADITEIDGFDDLHDPDGGCLSELSERLAERYGAARAFPLVNGSTGGILAAIRAMTVPGEEILVARNCHKSVYHAVELCHLRHVSLIPPTDEATGIYGSISPASVREALRAHPQIRAVVITSPTYEGVISDVRSIAAEVHAAGATLLVDAAHGAHLPFSENFPQLPTESDVTITSLHKTLPSLTQTAAALVYSKDASLEERLAREIAVFETSSPSYVLLASIERCVSLLEADAASLFSAYKTNLNHFYASCEALRNISLLTGNKQQHSTFFDFDRGKLVLRSRTPALNGITLASRLRREFLIEPEMSYTDYVLCMTSVCDTDATFERLLGALKEIDDSLGEAVYAPSAQAAVLQSVPERVLPIAEALHLSPAPLAAGEISRVYAWVYPPGVPLLVPGERVTTELLDLIRHLEQSGLKVRIQR